MKSFLAVLSLTTLWGCGGAEKQHAPAAHKPVVGQQPTEEAADGPLELPLTASFGALIKAINMRPERETTTEASCLIERSSSFALRAPTARAMRPLPPAPVDLDARLGAVADPVRLLTLWGQVGVEADRLVAVTFTATSASTTRPVVSLLTDRGIALRGEALSKAALTKASALGALKDSNISRLIVTAERDVPLSDVYAWLEEVQRLPNTPVALAVMLPEATRIPEPAEENAAELRCEDETAAPGDIDVQQVQAAVSALRSTLGQCLTRDRGTRGGKVAVRLGVSTTGEVDRGCIASGSLDGASIERCVIETLRTVELSAPTPAGSRATLLLPIVLRPKEQPTVRPFCSGS